MPTACVPVYFDRAPADKPDVDPKLTQPWLPLNKIEKLVQLEPAIVIVGLCLGAWLCYKLFLRNVSAERHRNLQNQFRNLGFHLLFAALLYLGYYGAHLGAEEAEAFSRASTYLGLFALAWGLVVFVKVWRILVFEYLFLSHMKVGVPVLLVNLFTLLLSVTLGSWLITDLFEIQVAPLLATSAIFSVVLGLAMQDTLGNLFAGVALQFDKPYEIGDWIEVQGDSQKWVGLVDEISWRATVLIGWTDEAITIPNRVMGQARIANFSVKVRPIARSQVFRIPYGASIDRARSELLEATRQLPRLRKVPAPSVIVTEAAESWIALKLVYFIDDYGTQFSIGDQVLSSGIARLEAAGIPLAGPRISVSRENAA